VKAGLMVVCALTACLLFRIDARPRLHKRRARREWWWHDSCLRLQNE
jgi:hypothetical protein